ncbi:Putative squalene synthase [Verticillium dahliae VDG1]|nr:Putative squalene synthase [Verticillium dahliae VDG1]
MAVKDGVSCYPTERLISRKARRHYRIPVKSQYVSHCRFIGIILFRLWNNLAKKLFADQPFA